MVAYRAIQQGCKTTDDVAKYMGIKAEAAQKHVRLLHQGRYIYVLDDKVHPSKREYLVSPHRIPQWAQPTNPVHPIHHS